MENPEVIKDFEELYAKYWNDDYVNLLAIVDTMNTALDKYRLYKLQRISKEELEKELSNLFILLSLYLMMEENSCSRELVRTQIQQFKSELKYKEILKSGGNNLDF